jgi:RNA polymerase sigma-70 factor (ECF subfamily)
MSSPPEDQGQAGVSPDTARALRAAARGDQGAWREIVARYGRRVHALVRSRCGREDLAEEVTQSVFVTLAEQLSSGEYTERGRFEAWLFRIAVNRLRDETRREARQATPTDPAALGQVRGAEVATRDDEEFVLLRGAIGRLSDADREVIELRHHADLSFKRIAEALGEPLGTVLARHHRALRKLRDLMSERPAGAGTAEGAAR